MQDEPKPEELIKAVADFLRNDIAPMISGHNAFKLRVSINALDLVTRQLTLKEGGDGHAALGRDVLWHDAALSHRTRAFDRARDDRPPLLGNRA